MKNLIKILLMFLVISFLNSCQDTLGVDEYSRTMVPTDSGNDSSIKLITYRYIDTVLDTVYIELQIDSNQNITEYGMMHESTLLMQEFLIWEYYKERSSFDIPWNPRDFKLTTDIELNYEDDNEMPSLDFKFKLEKLIEESIYDYYISHLELNFENIQLSSSGPNFDMYEYAESNLIINSKNNSHIELRNSDYPLTLIIHNVTFHPYKKNVPLLMEFEIISSQLADKLQPGMTGLRYIYYGFNIHGLVLFY